MRDLEYKSLRDLYFLTSYRRCVCRGFMQCSLRSGVVRRFIILALSSPSTLGETDHTPHRNWTCWTYSWPLVHGTDVSNKCIHKNIATWDPCKAGKVHQIVYPCIHVSRISLLTPFFFVSPTGEVVVKEQHFATEVRSW